jgi:hypothetical protein
MAQLKHERKEEKIPFNEGESCMDVANFSSIPKEINYCNGIYFKISNV